MKPSGVQEARPTVPPGLVTRTISAAVREANRVVVVTEEPDYTTFGRHLHSWIVQHHFDDMDLPPAFISGKGNIPSVPYNSPEEMAFYPTSKDIEAVLITFVSGATLWAVTCSRQAELQTRDGFLLVALVWTVLPAFATLPLLMYMPELDFTDGYFETVAALTTTGSTVLSGLDKLPPSINLSQ